MTDGLPRKRVVGYADRMSAAAGDTVRFMVSCEGPARYRADLVRLISGDRHPKGRGFIERTVASTISGTYPGRCQAIHAGSFAAIEDSGPLGELTSFTLQAMVWPTRRRQATIMGAWSEERRAGFALVFDASCAAGLVLGDGARAERLTSASPLPLRQWAFVAATFDAATGRATIHQAAQASHAAEPEPVIIERRVPIVPTPSDGPFAIAADVVAAGRKLIGRNVFNGKIDAPRVAIGALDRARMEAIRGAGPYPPHVLAAWDFSLGMTTDRIHDRSANRFDGALVNMPTRAMKGWNWTGAEMNWTHAPEQYGAIHFHDDDLHDAGWTADFELEVPDGLPSGIYAARIEAEGEVDHIPFIVRPPTGAPAAKAAFLVPTASYLAYANERGGLGGGGHLHAFANHLTALGAGDIWLHEHPEAGLSLYDRHSDGSGVAYSSRLRPIMNVRPGVSNSWVGTPWQFNADLPLIGWLDASGIACDVVTDEDLDAEGLALLAPYAVVLTGSHPEYWSRTMYEALEAYLARGGRLMYLGGNGFYWRVAFHPTVPGIMELRRAEDGIRDWVAEGGEYHHAFTGEYGGMWSRMGRPIHALAGVGMAAQGFDVSSYYRRTDSGRDPAYAWVFDGIEGDIIGDFGTVGGGAAGLELDRCDPAQGSPPHTVVLARSENHSDTYFPPPDEIHNASAMMDGRQNPNVRADMTIYTTPHGGAVFSVGSIAWLGSLSHNGFDNSVSRITRNVLTRFLDPTPLD